VNDYIRFFKDSEIKGVKIKRITEDDLDEFIRESITEKDLSQKAYSNLRTIVRGMFKYAKRRKYTDINISAFFQDIDLAKRMFKRVKHDPESQVFSETEIPRLIEWLDTHPRVSNYGVILALQTGLRTAELAALKYSDIQDNVLHVQRQEIKYKGETKGEVIHEIVDYCKTDMGDRYIYLTDSAIATIKKIKLMNPFGEYLMTENGKRVKTNTFNDRLRLACKSLGIPVRTMHKLRKTYGTTLIDNGVDESLIMQQMGHKDI
jgi:integrase